MKEFNVEYVSLSSGGRLSKAVSHWVRIWLSFHVVTVQVPCTARSRWLSSAQWLIPGHDLLSENHSQPGVLTPKVVNF